MTNDHRFWQRIPLKELTDSQWESLCDGCGQCCTHKLQDEDSGEIHYTNVVCRFLDLQNGRCKVYPCRHQYVPDCIKVTADNVATLNWMPKTCGYRLLAENKPLPKWHPLETDNRQSVKQAGVAVQGKVISEADIQAEDIEDYIVDKDYYQPVSQ